MADETSRGKSGWWRLGIIVILVAAIWAVFRFTALDIKDFSPTNIKDWILALGVWGPVVFIGLYALRAVVLVIPVGVMTLAGGLAYGKYLGTGYVIIGATLGACLSFLVARHLGRGFLDSLGFMKKGKLASFDESAARNGFKVILMARLIPIFQYDALNFGAGLSKIKFRDYALGTLVGMLPGGFIMAFLGSSLEDVGSSQFIIAIVLFALLILVPTISKLVSRKRGGKKDDASETAQLDTSGETVPPKTDGSQE